MVFMPEDKKNKTKQNKKNKKQKQKKNKNKMTSRSEWRLLPEWCKHGVHAEIPTRVVEAWYHAEIPTRVVEARCSCGDSHRSGPGMVFMPDDKQI